MTTDQQSTNGSKGTDGTANSPALPCPVYTVDDLRACLGVVGWIPAELSAIPPRDCSGVSER